MESPQLAQLWRLAPGPGFHQLLAGEAAYEDCLRPGPGRDLTVMPAGAPTHGAGAYEPGCIEALLTEACADHRLVIFDLPAADQLRQLLLVAKQLDQVLLVVRAEDARVYQVQRIVDDLTDDGIPLTGAVLNRRKKYLPRWMSRWV
jgi:Mrp family chromosome partitioning ATPase